VATPTIGLPRDDLIVELFRRRNTALLGIARSLLDSRQEAEEVVQESFERLVASFIRLDDPARADRYVTVTVLNLARSRLRRRRTTRRKAHLMEAAARDRVAAADNVAVADEDQVQRVRVAIQRLPKRQQQCVVMRFYAELSERDIADLLGLSTGSVKQHLSRARATLSAGLEDER